jgi:type III pantothenate kinase
VCAAWGWLPTIFHFQFSINKMNLIIDIGNTRAKAAVFDRGVLVEAGDAAALMAKYPVGRAIVSSVRGVPQWVPEGALVLDAATPIPLKNLYRTPATLGADRLAAAVGAHTIFPDDDVLVVDFGTALTVDLVTREGEFAGGNISPGMSMRLRALHEQTASLPLVEPPQGDIPLLGTTTAEAIGAGVVSGMLHEVEGYARRFPDAKIIFTGGDAKFFAERTKSTTFVHEELVLKGLNRILEYNE